MLLKHFFAPKLIGHLLALIVFSCCVFPLHPGRMFAGNDGPTSISVAQEQRTFFGISLNLHTNVLEGLGNLSHGAVNFAATPAYWFSVFHGEKFTPTASYIIFSIITFLATLLTGWNYGVASEVRYGAAWLLTLLFLPYFQKITIYPLPSGWPEITVILLLTALANIAMHRGGSGEWKMTIAYGLLLLLTLCVGLILIPVYLVTMLPFLFLSMIFSLYQTKDRAQTIRKIAMCLSVLLFAVVLHWTDYLLGLMLYTAPMVFP